MAAGDVNHLVGHGTAAVVQILCIFQKCNPTFPFLFDKVEGVYQQILEGRWALTNPRRVRLNVAYVMHQLLVVLVHGAPFEDFANVNRPWCVIVCVFFYLIVRTVRRGGGGAILRGGVLIGCGVSHSIGCRMA